MGGRTREWVGKGARIEIRKITGHGLGDFKQTELIVREELGQQDLLTQIFSGEKAT